MRTFNHYYHIFIRLYEHVLCTRCQQKGRSSSRRSRGPGDTDTDTGVILWGVLHMKAKSHKWQRKTIWAGAFVILVLLPIVEGTSPPFRSWWVSNSSEATPSLAGRSPWNPEPHHTTSTFPSHKGCCSVLSLFLCGVWHTIEAKRTYTSWLYLAPKLT